MTPQNERSFKPEYAYTLLHIAEGDLESAEVLVAGSKGRKENIGYLVAQVIEKSLKAVIVHFKKSIPLTNDLGVLLERVRQQIPMDVFSDVTLFSEYATFRRYEESSLILETSDLEAAIALDRQVLKWAQTVCA